MPKYFLYKSLLIFLIPLTIQCQKTEINHKSMETIFYQDNLESPLEINTAPVKIEERGSKIPFKDYTFSEEQKNYLTHYLSPERNSRLDSELPKNNLWELKWKSKIDSSAIPWYLLFKNERIIIQNESGWQLFDTSGKLAGSGVRSEGDITVSTSDNSFFVNDHSGYIQCVDLISGNRRYYVYPYLGKGFNRSVIYTNGDKIIDSGFELPVMTHNSPIKPPEMTILEEIKIGNPTDTDEDGVLKSTAGRKNILVKTGKIITALHDTTIVIAVTDHIYFIDTDLKVTKELAGDFIPLEMSLDEEMRIYLLANIEIEDKYKMEFWIIEPDGSLICKTEIPPREINNLTPPAIDYNHTAYIAYDDKIIAVSPAGTILWEKYIQKPLAGITVVKDYLFLSEGNILTAFDHNGERRFFYDFNEELSTSPVMVDNLIFIASRNYLYCLSPKK